MRNLFMRWVLVGAMLFPILGLGANQVFTHTNAKDGSTEVAIYGDAAEDLYRFLDVKAVSKEADTEYRKATTALRCLEDVVDKTVELEKGLPQTVSTRVFSCSFKVNAGGLVNALQNLSNDGKKLTAEQTKIMTSYGRTRFTLAFNGPLASQVKTSVLAPTNEAKGIGIMCLWSFCAVSFDNDGNVIAPRDAHEAQARR